MPFFSIIIPTLNSSKTLAIALESIIQQSFTDFEVLIMDGLSTDNTLQIAQCYRDERIKIFSKKDNGIYDAMNKGVKKALGDWLYFLGSDDELCSDILKGIYNEIEGKFDFIYGNVFFQNSKIIYDGEFNYFKLMKRNICHQAIFFRKDIFKKLGNYNINYRSLADYNYNMKIFHDSSIKKKYISKTIAIYNENGFAYNYLDEVFANEWKKNINRYFPFYVQFLVRHRTTKIVGRVINFMLEIYEK